MKYYIIGAIIYFLIKIIYNSQKPKGIRIGMSHQVVQDIVGAPKMSEGKTIRENYEKEVLYYGEFIDGRNRTNYKYKVTYINGKVSEIHEY